MNELETLNTNTIIMSSGETHNHFSAIPTCLLIELQNERI